jgi:hypothetical protein
MGYPLVDSFGDSQWTGVSNTQQMVRVLTSWTCVDQRMCIGCVVFTSWTHDVTSWTHDGHMMA